MAGITGGRYQRSYATRGYHHTVRDPQDDCSASYSVWDGDSANDYSFHVKKLEVADKKMMHGHAESVCGHTQRDHVRNDNSRDRLEVENITERYTRKQD